MPDAELLLRSAYRAFNARDVEAAVELMHPEADWANAWEASRYRGSADAGTRAGDRSTERADRTVSAVQTAAEV